MLENEGHWLKLMRNAIVPTDANICLRISGGDILCTVTKDVNKEVELKVTCRVADQTSNLSPVLDKSENLNSGDCLEDSEAISGGMINHMKKEIAKLNAEDMAPVNTERSTRESSVDKTINENKCNGDGYQEKPIRQEVPSSGKINSSDEETYKERKISLSSDVDRNNLFEDGGIYRCPLCTFQTSKRQAFEKHAQSHRSPSFKRATSHMTNAQSFCEACSIQFMSVDTYHVHKKYYCKSRHDKEETSQSPPVVEASPIARAFKPSADTVILRSAAVNEAVTPSLIQPQAIYAAISTNPLILLPCSLVNGEGLVAQNSVIATGGPGIVLQTGIACPTIVEKPPVIKPKEENPPSRKTSHPIMNFSSESSSERNLNNSSSMRKRKMSEGDVLNLKKTLTAEVTAQDMSSTRESIKSPLVEDQDIPLDLSLKRRKLNNHDQNVSPISRSTTLKRKNSCITRVECSSPIGSGDSCSSPRSVVMSTSRMAASPSSSYSNESMHCYSSQMPVLIQKPFQALSDRLSPAPPILPAETSNDKNVLPPGMPPPKLLKQGNNVCEACNIVFYKLDNYLAHKQHYCAFRRQQLSALAAAASAAALNNNNQDHSSDDNNSNHSVLNESIQAYTMDESSKPVQRRTEPSDHIRTVIAKPAQTTFVCDACGVKYSSADTLSAHQTYYCSKRADSVMSKFVNSRNENSSPSSCEPTPFSGPEEWKCNFCDATCSSYETIRRHLLTHSELKRFRCLVCGYKGNTLRGMRNHACTHLNENTTSVDEFVSSTVISENGAFTGIIQANEFSDEDSDPSKDHLTNRERTSSESHRLIPAAYEVPMVAHTPDSNEASFTSSVNDSSYKDTVPNTTNSLKAESRDSSPEASGSSPQDGLNPLAFCDVVIKTENDQTSSGEESQDGRAKPLVKSEPEPDPESDSDGRDLVLSESPPLQPTSVIRCVPDRDRCGENIEQAQPSKRKSRTQTKVNSEKKYCKSCDISFCHMSNFVAHKKYYCSRPVPNCLQETTTVQ